MSAIGVASHGVRQSNPLSRAEFAVERRRFEMARHFRTARTGELLRTVVVVRAIGAAILSAAVALGAHAMR
jgi:hypothetical protein